MAKLITESDVIALKKASLFHSSTLGLACEYKYGTYDMLRERVEGLRKCDDLTQGEVKMLAIMEHVLSSHEKG